jgi:ketoreductase RED1
MNGAGMNDKTSSDVLSRYSKVAVIGAGVIGASWTAVFLAHGLAVVVNDPRDDVESVVDDYIRKAIPTLQQLGLPTDDLARKLRFEADLDRAVADVDLVQENGPERIDFKQDLWARIERKVPAHALLLSSSSAKTATEQSLKMENASRLLVGHPFNPPHLIPLVEVVPGERTEPRAVGDAVAFYKALGKVPRVLRKEIQGFVANRLQRAIFRECCHLVLEGVVTVDELDDIVTSSIGLRWAADGPFRSFHLGGGPGGFPAFFKQFAPGMEAAWKSQAPVTLDAKSQQTIIDQAQASFAATPPEKLEAERDAKQLAIIHALASVKASGRPS